MRSSPSGEHLVLQWVSAGTGALCAIATVVLAFQGQTAAATAVAAFGGASASVTVNVYVRR